MMRSLRAFFLTRLLREKILLLVFIGLGTLIWLSAFSSRAAAFWREQHSTGVSLDTQRQLLGQEAQINAAVERAAAQLDSSKTYNETRLVAEVSNLASAAGFRNTSGDPVVTRSNGEFAVHTFTYTIRNIPQSDWMALQKFYVSLRDRAPYIGIDQFTLNSPNRAQLHLTLQVSAFEPTRP